MRQKTDQQILDEVAAEVRRMFGIEPQPKRRTRTKDPLDFILWRVDGKNYRKRKNALATGKKPKRETLDALSLLEFWETEGYETKIEDMTHDEYIEIITAKVAEYRGH